MPPLTPATTPILQIQQAYLQRMVSDAPLRSLLNPTNISAKGTGVYDHVPENVIYPFIEIGHFHETADNVHGSFGRSVLATLHVWTESRGYKQGVEIVNRITALFDHCHVVGHTIGNLTLVGHKITAIRFESLQTLKDQDPRFRHLIVSYRNITEQE